MKMTLLAAFIIIVAAGLAMMGLDMMGVLK